MTLQRATLAQSLKDTFKNAKDQNMSSDDVADALATAIDAYVSAATVVGVSVAVVGLANQPLGTGTQTGVGSLK